jgi:hypothetical protein
MDLRLLAAWSSRRQAIEARRGAPGSRLPSRARADADSDRGDRASPAGHSGDRDAKHQPRSLGEQRATWRREALALLGGPSAVAGMLDDVLRPRAISAPRLTAAWVQSADRVLNTVAGQRATWQVRHVRAEAERVVRAAALAPGDVDTAVTRSTEKALSPTLSIPLGEPDTVVEPTELRRSDGASVYTVAGAQLYTKVVEGAGVEQQDDGRDHGQDGFDHNPVVPKQPPGVPIDCTTPATRERTGRGRPSPVRP